MDSNKRNTAFLLLFLAIQSISFAQDCNSLRQPNETYGLGEGKDASWCNMQNPTAYTDCMCEQEKANKVSATEQQNLQKQALSKSTEASALYQQAHNLATQANLDKDPSKLDKAKALYQQAIALSKQAKGFIEQAYAGSDANYNRLKNLYLEQYNKQIEWATTGIESIAGQKDRIKAETNKEQLKTTPIRTNNWNIKLESNEAISTAVEQQADYKQVASQLNCSNWEQISGTCLDTKGKGGLEYQKCYIKETETHVIFKISIRPTQQGVDATFYKRGMNIFAGENEKVTISCSEFNSQGYNTEVSINKKQKNIEWDSNKKAFYMTLDKKYKQYAGTLYIECLY